MKNYLFVCSIIILNSFAVFAEDSNSDLNACSRFLIEKAKISAPLQDIKRFCENVDDYCWNNQKFLENSMEEIQKVTANCKIEFSRQNIPTNKNSIMQVPTPE